MLLFLILTGPNDGIPKDIQALCFNRNSNHLAITFLTEAVLEQTFDYGLQLTLNTPLQNQWGFDLFDASVPTSWVSGIHTRDLLSREQRF